MNKYLLNPYFAIAFGIGTGIVLTSLCQKLLNDYHKRICPPMSTHQLFVVNGVAGDAYYCVDKRYI